MTWGHPRRMSQEVRINGWTPQYINISLFKHGLIIPPQLPTIYPNFQTGPSQASQVFLGIQGATPGAMEIIKISIFASRVATGFATLCWSTGRAGGSGLTGLIGLIASLIKGNQ